MISLVDRSQVLSPYLLPETSSASFIWSPLTLTQPLPHLPPKSLRRLLPITQILATQRKRWLGHRFCTLRLLTLLLPVHGDLPAGQATDRGWVSSPGHRSHILLQVGGSGHTRNDCECWLGTAQARGARWSLYNASWCLCFWRSGHRSISSRVVTNLQGKKSHWTPSLGSGIVKYMYLNQKLSPLELFTLDRDRIDSRWVGTNVRYRELQTCSCGKQSTVTPNCFFVPSA